jgi:hypothetical protein
VTGTIVSSNYKVGGAAIHHDKKTGSPLLWKDGRRGYSGPEKEGDMTE